MNNLFLYLILLGPFIAFGQKKKDSPAELFLFDKNWNPCKQEKAVYLGESKKIGDSAYQWHFYHYAGALISVETYKNIERNIPHGYFAWYDTKGRVDSCGYTLYGKKNGSWLYYTDSLTVWLSKNYSDGILISEKDSIALKEEKRKMDSIGFLPGDKEAFFKGSDKAWIGYLPKKMKLPARAVALNTQGVVIAFFCVAADGRLEDIRLYQSIEYSLDAHVRHILAESPPWDPAIQLDRPVRAYRKQPFTFRW